MAMAHILYLIEICKSVYGRGFCRNKESHLSWTVGDTSTGTPSGQPRSLGTVDVVRVPLVPRHQTFSLSMKTEHINKGLV